MERAPDRRGPTRSLRGAGVSRNSLNIKTVTPGRYRPQKPTVSPYLALSPGAVGNLAAVNYFTIIRPEIVQRQISQERKGTICDRSSYRCSRSRTRREATAATTCRGRLYDSPQVFWIAEQSVGRRQSDLALIADVQPGRQTCHTAGRPSSPVTSEFRSCPMRKIENSHGPRPPGVSRWRPHAR